MRFLLFSFCVLAFCSCSKTTSRPRPGYYTLSFITENSNIPARLDISERGEWHIINADEDIRLDSVVLRNDSFFVRIPLFDSSLSGTWRNDSLLGVWTDHSRINYSIPFNGFVSTHTTCEGASEDQHYEITFSPGDSAESSKGIAVLKRCGDVVTGTVLTETGDYRYLQGECTNKSIWLSAFDGTHLFYLSGTLVGDSIIDGIFLSGKHWKESWVASKTNSNSLRDPKRITSLFENVPVEFTVLKSGRDSVRFNSDTWNGRVSIIQIMGSWCPNCTDESRFLNSIYEKHKNSGLHIIPVAFERGDDISLACDRLHRQFNQLQITYPFYYGGKSGKENAQKTLPFLNGVHSFPTTIFIDKKGAVRQIFTGFYGPGTKQEYEKHTTQISALIEQLLAE